MTVMALYVAAPVPCDEYYMGDSGILTHPNFPFNYSAGRQCLQRIYFTGFTSQNEKKICFRFHLFQLSNSSGCFDDYLEFPGYTGMVRYCGNGIAGQDYGDNRNPQNVFMPNFCCEYFSEWAIVLWIMVYCDYLLKLLLLLLSYILGTIS